MADGTSGWKSALWSGRSLKGKALVILGAVILAFVAIGALGDSGDNGGSADDASATTEATAMEPATTDEETEAAEERPCPSRRRCRARGRLQHARDEPPERLRGEVRRPGERLVHLRRPRRTRPGRRRRDRDVG